MKTDVIKSFQNVNNILCKQYNQMWVFFWNM